MIEMEIKIWVLLVVIGCISIFNASSDAHAVKKHGGHHWDYRLHGPETWKKSFPVCGGHHQSPINIVTCETETAPFADRILAHNFQKRPNAKTYEMMNNGHALQINLPHNTVYFVRRGMQKYVPLQVHIHFDPFTGKGSEHTLNSRKYFAEIHIVHKNAKYGGHSFLKKKDGLLVIGIFVELIKHHGGFNLDFRFHKSIKTWEKDMDKGTSFIMGLITSAAKNLKKHGNRITLPAFPLGWILPVHHRKNAHIDYVTYKGSLTTPPCSEIVDWVVITGKTLKINEKLTHVLKHVYDATKKHMGGNNRPIQDLNHRDVYGVKGSI